MPALRHILAASLLASVVAPAAFAPAAEAPLPVPAVRLKATVTPGRLPIPKGTPFTTRLDFRFASRPAGGAFVMERAVFLFGKGAAFNGRIFPSCSVARLRRAKGALKACPKGSRVGGGVAVGTAVDLGITSSARLTLFNGPGGRSIVMNVKLVNPVAINATFPARMTKLAGKYPFKLSAIIPQELRRALDSDIVVSRFDVTTGATRVIDGVKRGYFEAGNCPSDGSPLLARFGFAGGVTASVRTTVVC